MKLTCPECTTQFKTKPGAIGPRGRTVRCSECKTEWFASANHDSSPQTPEPAEEKVDLAKLWTVHESRIQADKKRNALRKLGLNLIWILPLAGLAGAATLAA